MCMTCASQAPAVASSLSVLAPYGVAATAAAGAVLLRRPRRSAPTWDDEADVAAQAGPGVGAESAASDPGDPER
jgi:hypothetical protein